MKIFKFLFIGIAAAVFFSCNSEPVLYNGPVKVGFVDSLAVIPVEVNNYITDIEVTVSNVSNKDRYYAVEPIAQKSFMIDSTVYKGAQEGLNYEMIDQNVLIPAGERVGTFKIKAYYESLKKREDIVVKFRIIAPNKEQLSDVTAEMAILLVKVCPFDVHDFEGYYMVYATFPFSATSFVNYFAKARALTDHSIELKGLIDTTEVVTLKFHDDDPLDTQITMAKQAVFTDAQFGTIHASTMLQQPSYFLTCDKSISLNLRMEVVSFGSFGIYPYILTRISDEEMLEASGKDDPIRFPDKKDQKTNTFKLNNYLK